MSERDFSVDALVIREQPSGEHDKLLTLLTADRGRLLVKANAARTIRSRLRAPCQAFVWGNFELHAKSAAAVWVRDASVTEGFPEIRTDIEKMYLAQYIADLCMELSGAGEPAGELLRLALNSFHALCLDLRPGALIKAVFEWRAAAFSGYLPDLGGCGVCGDTSPGHVYLDVMNGRLICAGCVEAAAESAADASEEATENGVATDGLGTRRILLPLTGSVLAALRYVLEAPPRRVLSFELKRREDAEDFCHACETYLLNHLGRGFSSLKYYKEISRT